jgi:opacity protein-like surface antigen
MARVLSLTTCLLCALSSYRVTASDGLEFVPFIGYRFGGSFDERIDDRSLKVEEQGNWGFSFSTPASSTTRYEFLYSRQESRLTDKANPQDTFDLDIHYLQLGGTLDLQKEDFVPFFSGGIGLSHMRPGRGGYTNETRLSLSLGGGLKWYPTDQLGFRFEMRGYGTLMDTSGTLFCDGGCELRLRSDLFSQFETNLGLIFRF